MIDRQHGGSESWSIAARRLSRDFTGVDGASVAAVCDVSLDIPSASFTLFSGPSGSGKTTLLSLLGVLDPPTSGELTVGPWRVDQCNESQRTRVRRSCGFVLQHPRLIPRLTVRENIHYPLIARRIERSERIARAEHWLRQLDLDPSIDGRLPGQLSGGQQQRVALARAMAVEPQILFADEPTASLDDEAAEGLMQLLADCHGRGLTVVVASHDIRFRHLATAQYRLLAGSIVNEESLG